MIAGGGFGGFKGSLTRAAPAARRRPDHPVNDSNHMLYTPFMGAVRADHVGPPPSRTLDRVRLSPG